MKSRKGLKYVPGLAVSGAVLAMALGSGGCSSINNANNAISSAQCNEFSGGVSAVSSLSIDENTKAFVTASAELHDVATSIEQSVMTACVNIDKDLGVTDTWSSKSSDDDKVTEACNQASTKIKAVLQASAQVSCSLSIIGGQCTVDASAQTACEAKCVTQAACTPGDVTTRCDPAQLTGQCDAMCKGDATCEGNAMVDADCQGSCEADCTGECDVTAQQAVIHCEGTCTGKCTGTCDGNACNGTQCAGTCAGKCDANCTAMGSKVKAHCDGLCKGKCNGNCKLDSSASANCGAMVNCKGGCTAMYTAPKCETKLNPPMCSIDMNCEASCQSHAQLTATCSKPSVEFQCDGMGMISSDLTNVINTVKQNLPDIIDAVKVKGALAFDAASRVATAGKAVIQSGGSLMAKSLGCATQAAAASVTASASVSASVNASAGVSTSCGGPDKAS